VKREEDRIRGIYAYGLRKRQNIGEALVLVFWLTTMPLCNAKRVGKN
jgi:hypothetical protein